MSENFDQIAYIQEYNKEHYDAVTIRLPKGCKDRIKQAAESAGMSLNAYIVQTIMNGIK